MNRITLVAGSVLALFAASASAGDHTITAFTSPNRFEPETLTINAGDTVTFVNGGGFHNVLSDTGAITEFRCADGCDGDGGNGDASSDPWTAQVVFPTAGEVGYHCEIHGGDGGAGMSGTITIVGGGGTPIIAVEPIALGAVAEEGASTVVPLAIGNTGDADLTWTADTASTDCATPDTVSWLSLAPAAGTVVAGDPAADVDVTLDATALTAGVYNANVCVHSNDATNDLVTVPVEFTVNTVDVIFVGDFDG